MAKENERTQVSQKLLLILNVGGTIIVFVAFGLSWFIIDFFRIDLWKMSFFVSCRTLLLIIFSVLALPLATFGEYWLSLWKRRNFLWRSVIVTISVIGIFIFVTIFLLTILEVLFAELYWIWQMPLAAICNLVGLFAMVAAIKNSAFKKWRKDLGW